MQCGTRAASRTQRADPHADLSADEGDIDLISRTFHPNLVLFWLTQTMAVSPKRLHGKVFTTIGPIPTGKHKVTFPLRQVSMVEVGSRLRVLPLILAAAIILGGGLLFNVSAPLAILTLLIGLGALATSPVASLEVTTSGGLPHRIDISPLEKRQLSQLADTTGQLLMAP